MAIDYAALIDQLRRCNLDMKDDRRLAEALLRVAADEMQSLVERNKLQAHEIAHLQGAVSALQKRVKKKES